MLEVNHEIIVSLDSFLKTLKSFAQRVGYQRDKYESLKENIHNVYSPVRKCSCMGGNLY